MKGGSGGSVGLPNLPGFGGGGEERFGPVGSLTEDQIIDGVGSLFTKDNKIIRGNISKTNALRIRAWERLDTHPVIEVQPESGFRGGNAGSNTITNGEEVLSRMALLGGYGVTEAWKQRTGESREPTQLEILDLQRAEAAWFSEKFHTEVEEIVSPTGTIDFHIHDLDPKANDYNELNAVPYNAILDQAKNSLLWYEKGGISPVEVQASVVRPPQAPAQPTTGEPGFEAGRRLREAAPPIDIGVPAAQELLKRAGQAAKTTRGFVRGVTGAAPQSEIEAARKRREQELAERKKRLTSGR
jgi:hypothetical protein